MTDPTPLEPRPKLSRRASTSSVTSLPLSDDVPSPSLHPQPVLSSDPPVPQSVTPLIKDTTDQIRTTLAQYLSEKDPRTRTYVAQLLQDGKFPHDAGVYDVAIQAVVATHESKDNLSVLTKLFDEMARRGISPSAQAFQTLILAYLDRDNKVANDIVRHRRNITSRQATNQTIQKHYDLDVKTISALKSEPNLRNAIRIFQAASKARVKVPSRVYVSLIRGCVRHVDEYAAVRVLGHLEKEHGSCIPSEAYYHMMQMYFQTNNVADAEETFSEFKRLSRLGNISYERNHLTSSLSEPLLRTTPWNLMIGIYLRAGRQAEAITILETMFDSSDPAVPRPSLSTFQAVLAGFCANDDVESTLKWFRRLLQETNVAEKPFAPLFAPPRPDATMWTTVVDDLIKRGMIDEVNSLYSQWLSTSAGDNPAVVGTAHKLVTLANIAHLESLQWAKNPAPSEVQGQVDHVVQKIVGDPHDWILTMDKYASDTMQRIIKLYGRDGRFHEAAGFLQTYVRAHLAVVGIPQAGAELTETQSSLLYALGNGVLDATEWILRSQVPPSFAVAREFVSVVNGLDKVLSSETAEIYLSVYEASKRGGQITDLTIPDAETLIAAGVCAIYANDPADDRPGSHPLVRFETLLTDIASHLQDLSKLSPIAIDGVLRGLQAWYPAKSLQAVLEKLGGPWSALWNQPSVQEQASLIAPSPAPAPVGDVPAEELSQPSTPSSGTAIETYRTSTPLSLKIDEHLTRFKTASPLRAYEKFLAGYSDGFYPLIATFGRLINALGRAGEIEKVNLVYETAQQSIATTGAAPGGRPDSPWHRIEDQMIIALAHAGDIDGAHNHRLRILEHGGTPSADAYGALISCVKDTTDDSANAYALYRESQIRGVVPNVYLYNTVISKLAKARKADLAMELFSRMKANGFWPSSVSYGAVIGACSRVGDVESAEALFEEMSSQPNFRPRVPPFNTMMQLYTYTKRDREKVLHYYDSMVSAGVRPTAHTYKVCPDPDCVPQHANLES